MKNGKVFTIVICNLIILILLFTTFTLCFSQEYINVFNQKQSPIYTGNKNSNYVSLMINVYWGTEYIEDMLKIFDKYNIKTTFFVGGTWVEKNPEMFMKIVENGHEIGNHGYFHNDQAKLNYQKNYDEIYVTQKLIEKYAISRPNLFAPPSGSFSDVTLAVAEELGYTTIMWSKDTIDWRDKDQNLIFSRATSNVRGGSLILMHPTSETVKALEKIIQYYIAHDLQVVTVSQNIAT